MKQTYEQRVRALAEKMAKVEFAHSYKLYIKYNTTHANNTSWSANFYRKNWEEILNGFLQRARIAVAEMAEAVIMYAYDGDMKAYKRNEANGGYVTNNLKEQGLIPDQELAKESAFEKAIRETVERNNGQEADKK